MCLYLRNFKFQSDSINTVDGDDNTYIDSLFKFQSDSINTQTGRFECIDVMSLNSNLILLIRELFATQHAVGVVFKFQSDSINTEILIIELAVSDPLNSNLILLILLCPFQGMLLQPPLNSNLILLIRFFYQVLILIAVCFKFQSDSINTEMCENFRWHLNRL